MDSIRIRTISEFHQLRGLPPPENPLISFVDYKDIKILPKPNEVSWILDFYHISIKHDMNAVLKYGQQEYDFNEGFMSFISPNQVFRIESKPNTILEKTGWMLLIHPEYLWNFNLAKTIKKYDFFDYSVNEALFLSKKEEGIINRIIENIQFENCSHKDKFSQNIIISSLETLLNYSERFYERQFNTRKIVNHAILHRLEEILNEYFNNALVSRGLPTVQLIANELNISPNYLSRLLKSLTGQSTINFIHDKLIEKAKEQLSTTDLSISEIAYQLGFEYPQYFSKLFKSKTNFSPQNFRNSFN